MQIPLKWSWYGSLSNGGSVREKMQERQSVYSHGYEIESSKKNWIWGYGEKYLTGKRESMVLHTRATAYVSQNDDAGSPSLPLLFHFFSCFFFTVESPPSKERKKKRSYIFADDQSFDDKLET